MKEFLEFTDEEATDSLSFEFRYFTSITSKQHTPKQSKTDSVITDVNKTVQPQEFIWNVQLAFHTGDPGNNEVQMTVDSHPFQLYSKNPNTTKTVLKLKEVRLV